MPNRIKELRKEKGLTLDEFSEAIKIPRATINRYENENSEPKLETWKKLADYFDVSVGYLQGLSTSRHTKQRLLELKEIMDKLGISYFETSFKEDTYDQVPDEIKSIVGNSINNHQDSLRLLMSNYDDDNVKKTLNNYARLIDKLSEKISLTNIAKSQHVINENQLKLELDKLNELLTNTMQDETLSVSGDLVSSLRKSFFTDEKRKAPTKGKINEKTNKNKNS